MIQTRKKTRYIRWKNVRKNGGLLPQNEKMRIVSAIEKLPNGDDIKQLRDMLELCVCVWVTIALFRL